MAKPQAESGEAERHPILRPDRMVFGNISGCQESQRADHDDETTGRDLGNQRGIPASGLPGRCSGLCLGHVAGCQSFSPRFHFGSVKALTT
ncbi:uncharacterized protein LOC134760535 isoform X4 [Pongo abelii]|uniref:uncharacterized protein LOC134760535 isoform X4 n=1 Tax=Pongo abelii TaxID=9601 RepID=UPI0023E84932|nr:uncharacterized protein LOC129051045 isoform X2 [Pongo abelii]XP_054391563.1 uncharacterized protein LOC129051057 isoform X2 [Pongo abelii]